MSNPDWALTDEEIMAIDSPGRDIGFLEHLYDELDEPDRASLLKYQRNLLNAGAKKLVEWGNEDCPHAGYVLENAVLHKRECFRCWQALEKAVGLEDG